MRKTEEENNHLGWRINEMEEQVEFLQEKLKDRSSLEALRGKALEAAKQQIKQLKST
jgi:DNA-binding protein H-NS